MRRLDFVHKLCRPLWPGYLKPLSRKRINETYINFIYAL